MIRSCFACLDEAELKACFWISGYESELKIERLENAVITSNFGF